MRRRESGGLSWLSRVSLLSLLKDPYGLGSAYGQPGGGRQSGPTGGPTQVRFPLFPPDLILFIYRQDCIRSFKCVFRVMVMDNMVSSKEEVPVRILLNHSR